MINKRRVTMLGVIPVWFFVVIPSMWLFLLPIKFLLLTITFWLCAKAFSALNFKELFQKGILRCFVASAIADLSGTAFLFLSQGAFGDWWYEYITTPVVLNPADNIWSLSYTLVGVFIAVAVSYLLHRKASLKKLNLEEDLQRKVALGLAIMTMPVLYLMPSRILYDGEYPHYSFTNHIVWSNRYACDVIPDTPVSVESEALTYADGFIAGYYLADALNTASKATSSVNRAPEYRLRFWNPDAEADIGVAAELWFLEDGSALFRVDGQFYLADAYQSAEVQKVFNGEAQQEMVQAQEEAAAEEAAQSSLAESTVIQ